MPVLALDTSQAIAVAVIGDSGDVLAERVLVQERRHVEQLAPMTSAVLRESRLKPRDLDHVVVGTGPAPFTGLRVGLVTARAFAFAAGLPVYGVSDLDAIATLSVEMFGFTGGTQILVTTDAKRREVYWAKYEITTDGVQLLAGPGVAAPASLVEDGTVAGTVVVGEGARLYAEVFRAAGADVRTDLPGGATGTLLPAPRVLARLAADALARGERPGTEPLYLRRPDAQVPVLRKRATR